MKNIFEGKTILITGGTGYIGRNLIRRLLPLNPHSIRVFSRDEVKHFKVMEDFKNNPKLRSLVGDLRDYDRVNQAAKGCDIIIHAGAMKRIDMIEYNVFEAIKTNVMGSMNVVRAALENEVEKAILVSTDKTCSPVNTYGATKMLAERAFIESNYNKGASKTILACVRYGNVTESTGSAIPYFIQKIKQGEDIPLTHEEMTRFAISPDRAVDEVFNAIEYAEGGETFIPKLNSYNVRNLIEVLLEYYQGNNKIKVIGVRPGEKIHELLLNEEEAQRAYEFKDSYVILSQIDKWNEVLQYKYLNPKKPMKKGNISSKDFILSKKDLVKKLKDDGILK